MRDELVPSLIAAEGGIINLTIDCASNYNAHAYLCITGHRCGRGSSVQRKAGLLNVGVLDIEHRPNTILCCLKEKIREWEETVYYNGFVVSDNAANVVEALSNYVHIHCISHMLHLVVNKALELDRIVTSLLSQVRSISGFIHHNQQHELQMQLNLFLLTL